MYVGQQPSTTFDSGIQDRFTGLTTNTVTLTHDISAETDILVVWNNIVQDSSTYSVGGAGNKTLTLGGSLVSADIVTVYYTNKVMQSVNPTAGSVGITELNVSDGSNGHALTTNGSGTLSFADVAFGVSSITGATALAETPAGTDEFVISDAGTLKRLDAVHLFNQPFAQMFRDGNQGSFPNNSTSKVELNGTSFSSGGTVDTSSNYRFTPGVAGKYFCHGSVKFDTGDSNDKVNIQIYVSGSQTLENQGTSLGAQSSSARDQNYTVSGLVNLSASDYVELYAYQNQGSSITITGGAGKTFLNVFRIT